MTSHMVVDTSFHFLHNGWNHGRVTICLEENQSAVFQEPSHHSILQKHRAFSQTRERNGPSVGIFKVDLETTEIPFKAGLNGANKNCKKGGMQPMSKKWTKFLELAMRTMVHFSYQFFDLEQLPNHKLVMPRKEKLFWIQTHQCA